MKKVVRFLSLILWPFAIVVGLYLWQSGKVKEGDRSEYQELLSDTAKVNAAHRTYEKVKLQQMLEDSDAVELAKKVLEAKDPMRKAGQ
jgi:hypothetical protein